MSATRNRSSSPPEDEAPASVAQTTPASIGFGHPNYNFVQSIMEMQKSLGEINASLIALNKTTESTKSKVEALTEWKNKILGGAIVLGVIGTCLGILITKFSSYITLKAPEAQLAPVAQIAQPAQASTPAVIPPQKNRARRINPAPTDTPQ